MNERKFTDITDDYVLVDGKIFVRFAQIFKRVEDASSLESLEAILEADLDYLVATYLEAK